MASEGKVRETLIDAQLANVIVYTVDISQFAVRLTEKPAAAPAQRHRCHRASFPWARPRRPPASAQNFGVQNQVQFAPLLKEIYTTPSASLWKTRPKSSPKAPGGAEFSFLKQRGLEDAIQRISQEIRSQYLITYNPNNKGEPGFHEIAVVVDTPLTPPKPAPVTGSAAASISNRQAQIQRNFRLRATIESSRLSSGSLRRGEGRTHQTRRAWFTYEWNCFPAPQKARLRAASHALARYLGAG